MAKLQSIKNVYGSNEHALTADEAVVYLEKRMIKEQGKSDGQSLDNSILDYAKKYGINERESHASLQREEMCDEAIARIRGVDERFEFITAEALQCMNKEYFGYLMDASYSQDTQAPEVVSQGIEACEGVNGNVFTTAELLESAQYIVDDYDALKQYVIDTYGQDVCVDNQNLITVNDPAEETDQKEITEQMQLDFGEAVEQLSFDLDGDLKL